MARTQHHHVAPQERSSLRSFQRFSSLISVQKLKDIVRTFLPSLTIEEDIIIKTVQDYFYIWVVTKVLWMKLRVYRYRWIQLLNPCNTGYISCYRVVVPRKELIELVIQLNTINAKQQIQVLEEEYRSKHSIEYSESSRKQMTDEQSMLIVELQRPYFQLRSFLKQINVKVGFELLKSNNQWAIKSTDGTTYSQIYLKINLPQIMHQIRIYIKNGCGFNLEISKDFKQLTFQTSIDFEEFQYILWTVTQLLRQYCYFRDLLAKYGMIGKDELRFDSNSLSLSESFSFSKDTNNESSITCITLVLSPSRIDIEIECQFRAPGTKSKSKRLIHREDFDVQGLLNDPGKMEFFRCYFGMVTGAPPPLDLTREEQPTVQQILETDRTIIAELNKYSIRPTY